MVARTHCLNAHSPLHQLYAWVFTTPPHTNNGVVTNADDWSLSEVVWVFTVAIVFLGLAAALQANGWNRSAHEWLALSQPAAGAAAIVGTAGIMTHQRLLYLATG